MYDLLKSGVGIMLTVVYYPISIGICILSDVGAMLKHAFQWFKSLFIESDSITQVIVLG